LRAPADRARPHAQVADRDRAKGLVGPRGELLRNKRPVQMHLHTSASPRVFMERNGAQRDSMHEHVNRKAAWAVPPTPRAYAAEPLLPRNLVDTEDDEAPKPMTSHSVFARPNRCVCSVLPLRSRARAPLLSPSCPAGVAGCGMATRCDMFTKSR
jgi:hypothetical protein